MNSEITLGPMTVHGVSPVQRKAAADPRNTVRGGSCEDFMRHVAETGAYDSKGVNHPGKAGWTDVTPTVEMSKPKITTEYKNMWFCPSTPGVYYETQSACEAPGNPCASGLGGSMVKCGGAMVYFMKMEADLSFNGEINVSMLVWKPEKPSPECTAAKKAFDDALKSHEDQHVADAKAIVEAANKLAALQLGLGAPVENDAMQRLKEEAEKALKEILKKMSSENDMKIKEFHDSSSGGNIVMDCSGCP